MVFNEDALWLNLIREDLQWMWSLLCNTSTLRDPAHHFGDWTYILTHHRGYWKRLVQRAVALELLHVQDRLLLKLHRGVYQHLAVQGVLPHRLLRYDPAPDQAAHVFGCMQCWKRKRCKTRGCEGAHLFRVHGRVAAERLLFEGTSCPGCLKEYHTFAKLQQHLRRDVGCRQYLLGMGGCRQPAPGKGPLANEALHQQHDGLLPVQQALGPHDPRIAPRQADEHHPELYEALALVFFEAAGHPDDSVFQRAQDAEAAQIDLADWMAILQRLGDHREWPFLMADEETHLQDNDFTLEELEPWCDLVATSDIDYTLHQDVPRPAFVEKVVVHAFSGRRRHGDLRWFIEELAERHHHADVYVVSLDIIIDSAWGDIGRPETHDFWLWLCDWPGRPTLTSGTESGEDSTEELWGFRSLSLKEKRQVMDGHRLLAFSLTAMPMMYFSGGAGVLEHPDEPTDLHAASIWKLPLMHLLLSLAGFARVSLAQGLLGASSVKRTCLLTLNLAHLPACIRDHAICSDLPRGQNIGVAEDGTFKTAILKEYPPAFCHGLADAFCKFLPHQADGRQHIPAETMHRFRSMVCQNMGTAIGPDYAGV
eukprot:s676_g14.t1